MKKSKKIIANLKLALLFTPAALGIATTLGSCVVLGCAAHLSNENYYMLKEYVQSSDFIEIRNEEIERLDNLFINNQIGPQEYIEGRLDAYHEDFAKEAIKTDKNYGEEYSAKEEKEFELISRGLETEIIGMGTAVIGAGVAAAGYNSIAKKRDSNNEEEAIENN